MLLDRAHDTEREDLDAMSFAIVSYDWEPQDECELQMWEGEVIRITSKSTGSRWLVGSRSERRQTFWPYPIQPRRGGIVHQTERLAHDNVSKDAIAGSRADKEGPHSQLDAHAKLHSQYMRSELDALIEDGYTHATRESLWMVFNRQILATLSRSLTLRPLWDST